MTSGAGFDGAGAGDAHPVDVISGNGVFFTPFLVQGHFLTRSPSLSVTIVRYDLPDYLCLSTCLSSSFPYVNARYLHLFSFVSSSFISVHV